MKEQIIAKIEKLQEEEAAIDLKEINDELIRLVTIRDEMDNKKMLLIKEINDLQALLKTIDTL